jgi:alpha-amylase
MKRGKFWGRVLSAAGLSLSIFLSSFGNVSKSYAMDTEAVEIVVEETASTTARDKVHDGAILHAFCWSFNTIAENMADIADAGYTAVQTSPINECLSTNPGMNLHGPDGMWYYHYQPTDWVIGNYQLGSRDEFKHMCDVAEQYGVAVIVDILPNHTTPVMGSVSEALKEAAGGEDALFHTTGKTGGGYTDRVELTYYSMGGLPDVDTENPGFQQYFYEFLKDCVYLGADGFRIDTCKHISLPDDPVPADYEDADRNNFYTNMREALDEYSVEAGTKNYDELFVYGEVLQGTNDRLAAYQEYVGGTTASNYGSNIRSALSSGNFNVSRISDYQIYDETVNGRTYYADSEKLVTWVESHDNYMNDSESCWKTIDDTDVILGWSYIAARKDGTPLFFSRPNNSSAENPYGDNLIGAAGSPIYKAPEVKAVNRFRQEMGDAEEYLSNPGGIQTVMVERKGDAVQGAVIINSSVNRTTINAATVLEDGIYPNQVEGSDDVFLVKDGVITGSVNGESVVVLDERIDSTGKIVYFYNSDKWSEVVARVDSDENTVNTVNDNDGWYWATVLDDEFNVTFENSDGSAVSPTYEVTNESGTYATLKDSTLYFSKAEAEEAIGLHTYPVYFFNTEAWESVNSYGWLTDGTQLFGGWPGTPAINEGSGWWRAEVKAYDDITAFNVIFNNGSGKQTVNIEGITPESEDIYVAVDAENSGDQLSVMRFTDKAAAEEALGVSGTFTTAYFYNTEGWDTVCAYTWGATALSEWPGKELTQDEDGWYSIVLPAGAGEDLNIIFNNGNNGKQTSDMKITDMKNRFFLHNGISYHKYGSKKEALADVIGGEASYTTAYFYNEKADEDSWNNVYLYVYGGANGEYNNLVGTWPGAAMTREEGTNWYTAEVPSNAIDTGTLTYIFNNGNGTQLDDNRDINLHNTYFTTSSTASFESKEAVYEYLGIGSEEPVEPVDPEDPVEPVDPVDPVEPEEPQEPEELQGEFVTRWGKTTFVTTDGVTVTGFANIQGNRYYFKANGTMVKTDFVTVDDVTYYFDGEGHMVTGFLTKWFTTYYFDETGAQVKAAMVTVDGDTYYANDKGAIVHSEFVTFEDGERYFDSEGKMVKGTTITRWFKKYTFDENGLLIG